jgi:thiosulfate reductase cytochrome b subunit
LQALDWTLVDPEGLPLRQYRRVDGDPATADGLINGFQPLLLPRDNVGGARKLAPFNLVSNWYWIAGEDGQRVEPEWLAGVLYPQGRLHDGLAELLDTDGDGQVQQAELRLDTLAKADAVRHMLTANGLQDVRLAADVTPYPVSHSVVNGRWANRDCRHCHEGGSVLGAAFTLSDYRPGGQLPVLDGPYSETLVGNVESGPAGGASFLADSAANGFYVLGHDSVELVDMLGLAMFLGITFGVSGHALARWMSSRGRERRGHPTRRVFMYDAYERLWHWLQAGAILILLFTGLIIHKPEFFGMFSFAYVVHVHNVLGFILLINAALALFYTVASGTIKRFLPEPKGFFGRAIAQTVYYTRGIFTGAPHPLEKTKELRLNPLQQITYLAILNILLPAQVITGVLIWGMQKWPQLAAALGGLPVLAPVHTFLAWAFSAFIVMHVYLTTASGETPTAGIKSMITGWEDVETNHRETVNV